MARELTAIVAWRGKLASIVSENGTAFTCNAMLAWLRKPDQLRQSPVPPPAPTVCGRSGVWSFNVNKKLGV